MRLYAHSIGCAVPRNAFDARVHSVYSTAANLYTNDKKLVTLFISDRLELPQGIRLDDLGEFSFDRAGLYVGQTVACRAGIVRFQESSFTVNFQRAGIWDCRLPVNILDHKDQARNKAWLAAWRALNRKQAHRRDEMVAEDLMAQDGDGSGHPGLKEKIGRGLHVMVQATQMLLSQEATEAAHSMIGLGPGLTPTGDDLLAGYFAGLWSAVGGRKDRLSFIHDFGEAVFRLADKYTNEISRSFLEHAIRGQVSNFMAHLAGAIAEGKDFCAVITAAEAAMSIGHTSGTDAVMGLLFGLEAFEQTPFLREPLFNGLMEARGNR